MDWQAILRSQLGVITFAQARQAGLSVGAIRRRLRTGKWRKHRFAQGLYVVRQVGNAFEQDCAAALLYAGANAVLSHRCAGKLLGLDDCQDAEVELTIPHGARRPALSGVKVHFSRQPERCDLHVRGALRFTGLVRTVVDLDGTASRKTIVAAYEHAFRMNIRNRARISERLAQLSRGRRTSSVLEELLARRTEADPPTANIAEAWCDDLLFQRGIATRRQVSLTKSGKFVARVDFAVMEICYAIEFDGFETHSSHSAQRRDANRKLKLQAIGWDMGQLTYLDVVSPGDAITDVVAAVELRRARFGLTGKGGGRRL